MNDTNPDRKPASLQDQVFELTGYEENRIEQWFPTYFDDLNGSMQQRALVFTTKVREAGDAADQGSIYVEVMRMKVRELAPFFGPHQPSHVDGDPVPEPAAEEAAPEGETPAGKGDASA